MGSHLLREGEQLFLKSPALGGLKSVFDSPGPPGKPQMKATVTQYGDLLGPMVPMMPKTAPALIDEWLLEHSVLDSTWTDAKGIIHSCADPVSGCAWLAKAFKSGSKTMQAVHCKTAFGVGVPQELLKQLLKMDVWKWTPVHWFIWARTNKAAKVIYGDKNVALMLTCNFDAKAHFGIDKDPFEIDGPF